MNQNYNRYSYCLPARPQRSEGGNNPLIYTDPSGYSYLGDGGNVRLETEDFDWSWGEQNWSTWIGGYSGDNKWVAYWDAVMSRNLMPTITNSLAYSPSTTAVSLNSLIENLYCEALIYDQFSNIQEQVGVGGYDPGITLFNIGGIPVLIPNMVIPSGGGVTFDQLWNNYPSSNILHIDPSTKKDIFSDHCAINLSEALMKSGIKLKGGVRCWGNCPSGGGHFVRAQELANALNGRYSVVKLTGDNYLDYINGKQGIIFFQNYWQRDGESGRTGDHVDLWNGSYLKSNGWALTRLRLNFPSIMESFGSSDLGNSTSVWFWQF